MTPITGILIPSIKGDPNSLSIDVENCSNATFNYFMKNSQWEFLYQTNPGYRRSTASTFILGTKRFPGEGSNF